MQIHGAAYVHGPQPVNAPHVGRTSPSGDVGYTAPARDELSISSGGQFLDQVHGLPDVRQQRVDQIRAAIQSGTYLTDDKLSLALDGLLNEIA